MSTRSVLMTVILVSSVFLVWPMEDAVADHTGDGHDKPGPPPIVTKVKLTTIEHPDMDDGGGDAEVTVTITMEHMGHGSATHAETEEDLDWDITRGTWTINKDIYSHRECTPMESIKFTVVGLEADASNLDALEKKLVNAIGKLAEGKYSEKLEDLDIDADAIAKVLAIILSIINPDDSLGKGTATATGPGEWNVVTSGGDYTIRVNFEVTTTPVAGDECNPDAPPNEDPPPQWCVIGRDVYDTLYVAFDDIEELAIEEENPAGLTPAQMQDVTLACSALTEGIGRWAALRAVDAAWGYEGAQLAYARYLDATALDGRAAIDMYEVAFCQAIQAILDRVPDDDPSPMPLTACVIGDYLPTRVGRDVPFLTGVFGEGAHSVFIRNVLGAPPNSLIQIEPVHPNHPSWWTVTMTQVAPPGVYPVTVVFSDPSLPPQHVDLRVESIPIPAAPSDLVAVRGPVHRAVVTWQDHALNELGFHVERKLFGVDPDYLAIGSTGTNETSFTDETLVDPGVYCYRVNAFNNGGASAYSPAGCAAAAAGIERESIGAPGGFALDAAYPNPIVGEGYVHIAVAREALVSLTLHDASGKVLGEPLVETSLAPGRYRFRLDVSRWPAGFYHLKMAAREPATGAPLFEGGAKLIFIR